MLQTFDQPRTPNQVGAALCEAWLALKQAHRGLRTREAAERLGIAEAQLVAATCGKQHDELPSAIRLRAAWAEILHSVENLGEVMALTRNDSAVHEKTGRYANIEINGGMGLVLAGEIDLRLFLRRWFIGFAVSEPSPAGLRRSLQFFDADGTAVHKIYLTRNSELEHYYALVAEFQHDDQRAAQTIEAVDRRELSLDDGDIDVESLRSGWRMLQDTHEFFPLLRRHKVGRLQALRLAGHEFARRVSGDTLRTTLNSAASSSLPIMVFVGSPGVIQIHSGPIRKLKDAGPWFNVLDPDFNLHLKESDIASSWIVRKPTSDGDVTSLELFDSAGRNIAMLFGERKPGRPELPAWREMLDSIPGQDAENNHA